ncbi:MAG: hypothetical protein ACI87E_004714 [Mariniblastus sp.]|jgi:hypothetical protein
MTRRGMRNQLRESVTRFVNWHKNKRLTNETACRFYALLSALLSELLSETRNQLGRSDWNK